MKKIFILIITLFLFIPGFSLEWWNTSWGYKTKVIISNPSPFNFTHLQIDLNVSFKENMNKNFSDIRFIFDKVFVLPIIINSSDNLTDYQILLNITDENVIRAIGRDDAGDLRFYQNITSNPYSEPYNGIKYYVEKFDRKNKNLLIWVKINLSSIKNNTIYMYFGNKLAKSKSNPKEVFEFYDDFNDGLLTGWNVVNGVWKEENGYLHGYSSGGYASIYTVFDSSNMVFETKTKILDTGSGSTEGYHFAPKYTDNNNFVAVTGRPGENTGILRISGTGAWLVAETGIGAYNTWYKVIITYKSDGTIVFEIPDLNKIYTATDTVISPGNISFMVYEGDVYYDYLIARKYSNASITILYKNIEITNTSAFEIPFYIREKENGNWSDFIINLPFVPSGSSYFYYYYFNPEAVEKNYTEAYTLYDDFSIQPENYIGNWSWNSTDKSVGRNNASESYYYAYNTEINDSVIYAIVSTRSGVSQYSQIGVGLFDDPNNSFYVLLYPNESRIIARELVNGVDYGKDIANYTLLHDTDYEIELKKIGENITFSIRKLGEKNWSTFNYILSYPFGFRAPSLFSDNYGGKASLIHARKIFKLLNISEEYTISLETVVLFNLTENYTENDTCTVVKLSSTLKEKYSDKKINSTVSVNASNVNRLCTGIWCTVIFYVGSDPSCEISPGNITFIINATDVKALYPPASNSTVKYIEDLTTTGRLSIANVTAENVSNTEYVKTPITFTINNTGKAKMINAKITKYSGPFDLDSIPVFNLTPESETNITVNITIPAGTSSGEYLHIFNLSWINNDGSSSGNIYTSSYVIVLGNPKMELSNYTLNETVQHGTSKTVSIYINSTGNDPVKNIYINSSSQLVQVTPDFIQSLSPGASQELKINISVPEFYDPGTYEIFINVTSSTQKEQINISLTVPKNSTWKIISITSRTGQEVQFINETYGLNEPGQLGNITVKNYGNAPLNFTVDYTYTGNDPFGSGVFEIDKNISGIIYNPSTFIITPGETKTVQLYQNGFLGAIDFHIKATFTTNETGSDYVNVSWYILDKPPEISVLEYSKESELNKTMNIVSYIYDDQSEVSSYCLFEAPDGTVSNISASGGPGNGNYTCSYTPEKEGTYDVNITACDSSKCNQTSISFVSIGRTSITGSANPLSVNVKNITLYTSETFSLNISLKNTGKVSAYEISVTVPPPGGTNWNSTTCKLSSLNTNSSALCEVNVTVPEKTSPGTYTVRPYISWLNPNRTVSGFNYTETVTIQVSENKILNVSSTLTQLFVKHGSQNETVVILHSTGNANVSNISVICQANPCSYASLNKTFITSLVPGAKEPVLVRFSLPLGFPDGTYYPIINTSEGASVTLTLTVPVNRSWTSNTSYISIKAYAGKNSSIPVLLKNIGNGQILLSFSIAGNISQYFSIPQTETLETQKSLISFLNYSAPSVKSYLEGTITIQGPSETLNIPVNLSSYVFTLPMKPLKVENVTAGNELTLSFDLNSEENYTENDVKINVYVGNGECNITSKTLSGKSWNVKCTLPDLTDGKWYDVKVYAKYIPYSLVIENTSSNAVHYKDLTPPSSVIIKTQNVKINESSKIDIEVKDNSVVSDVLLEITYPNATVIKNYATKINNSYFTFTTENLSLPGIYLVKAIARDTGNNTASSNSWFRVGSSINLTGNLTDPSGNPLNATLKFINPYLNALEGSLQASGFYSDTLWTGIYHMEIEKPFTFRVRLFNVSIDSHISDPVKIDFLDGSIADLGGVKKLKLLAIEPKVNFTSVEIEFDLSQLISKINDIKRLSVFKCKEWNYSSRTCQGNWVQIKAAIDLSNLKIIVTSDSTSAYLLAETEESTTQTSTTYQTIVSGSSISTEDIKRAIEEILRKLEAKEKLVVRAQSISLELTQGDKTKTRIYVYNNYDKEMISRIAISGDVAKFIDVINPEIRIPRRAEGYFELGINIPTNTKEGVYYGRASITGEGFSSTVPVVIKVLRKSTRLLDLKIQPLQDYASPGSDLKLEVTLYSMGEGKRVDVNLTIMLIDPDSMVEIARTTESLAVETSLSRILTLKVPEEIPEKRYLIKAIARYLDVKQLEAVSAAYIKIETPLLERSLFGLKLWLILLLLLLISVGSTGTYYIYKKKKEREERRKRFRSVVEVKELPGPGKDSLYIGLLAETGIRAFVKSDDLKTHVMIAGATGSGKTVAAMVLAEEMLLKGKNVIVFDPTGQWSGFLRKCKEKHMLKKYSKFGLKESDARGFPGKIKIIKSPNEKIGLKELITDPEGKITVFVLNHLTPQEIDKFVHSTVEEIFKARLEESKELRAFIIYDEVHRLLEKFGGTGKGFLAVERGVREFRKWGIGLGLISQVLSDFVGEIKANIGMEIQMRTRYEGDLERIRMKYGEEYVSGIVKASVGTGMLVYSEYNRGRPYFVEFRPILHQVTRLSDKELEEYDTRARKIEEMKKIVENAKRRGVDVFDVETELKLAESKLSQGEFEMVDIYLEGLEPRIRRLMKYEKDSGRSRGRKTKS